MILPRMLHKTVNADDPASADNRCVVRTPDDLDAKLADGWVLSTSDLKAAKAEKPPKPAKAEKA